MFYHIVNESLVRHENNSTQHQGKIWHGVWSPRRLLTLKAPISVFIYYLFFSCAAKISAHGRARWWRIELCITNIVAVRQQIDTSKGMDEQEKRTEVRGLSRRVNWGRTEQGQMLRMLWGEGVLTTWRPWGREEWDQTGLGRQLYKWLKKKRGTKTWMWAVKLHFSSFSRKRLM